MLASVQGESAGRLSKRNHVVVSKLSKGACLFAALRKRESVWGLMASILRKNSIIDISMLTML